MTNIRIISKSAETTTNGINKIGYGLRIKDTYPLSAKKHDIKKHLKIILDKNI